MTAALVFVGAMVGAPLRFLTDQAIQRRHQTTFPWGTFAVNVVGSFVLGGLVGAGTALPSSLLALLGTGFCGALTTYSSFGYETIRLVEARCYLYAVINVALSVAAGVGAALLGLTLVRTMV